MLTRTIKTFSQFILENEIETISNSTGSDDILKKYLSTKPELIPIYKEIETKLKDKFTVRHFEDEIKYSGGLKELSVGLLPKTINSFKLLKKQFPNITYSDNSYRTYKNQKDVFLDSAKSHGNTISGALIQAALPGFSQHHTGKTLDVDNYKKNGVSQLTPEILKKYNFSLPYQYKTSFRMAEPWHIYYLK